MKSSVIANGHCSAVQELQYLFTTSSKTRNTNTTGVTVASPPLFAFHFDLAVIYLYLQKVAN